MKKQSQPVVLEPMVIDYTTIKRIIMKAINYIKAILLGLVMVLGVDDLRAQQIPLYSSYTVNPFLLSPSFAGAIDGNGNEAARLLLAHRSQFAGIEGSPITYVAALDAPIARKNMGLGGTVYTDKYGLIRQTGATLGYAYRVNLGDKSKLHFGLGGDIGQQSLDFSEVQAVDMTDNLLNMQSAGKMYFNGQFGIHITSGGLTLGMATNQTFGSQLIYKNYTSNSEFEYDMATHFTLFGGYRIEAKNGNFALTPMLTVRTSKGIASQMDLLLRADIKNKVFAVVGYRSGYAFSMGAGVKLKNNLTLSYTYDLMLNDASPYAGDGHEITLGYTFMKGGANARPACCDELVTDNRNDGMDEAKMRALFDVEVGELRKKMNDMNEENASSKKEMARMQREIDSLAKLKPEVVETVIQKVTIQDNFIVNNIEFETGSAKIRNSSYPELDEIADYLISNPAKKLEISGHSDNVGQASANLLLSQKRAKSVAAYFMSKGVPASRLTHQGYGQTKPKASNDTTQGKQRNRRVELKLAN